MALGSGSGGSRTLGRYELIAEVAKGQLGALWAAHSPESEDSSVVMIRRVPTSAPVTPDEIDHLSEGAWWSLEVQHPTLARAADVVMTDGELGIVMPYAEGEVLRSLLRLSSFKRKAIPVPVALKIALEVLDAVHQADTQAMPHTGGGSSYGLGGLVPDSVLVCRNGSVRLLDFGVAGPATKVGPLSRHPEMAAYVSRAARRRNAGPARQPLRRGGDALGDARGQAPVRGLDPLGGVRQGESRHDTTRTRPSPSAATTSRRAWPMSSKKR